MFSWIQTTHACFNLNYMSTVHIIDKSEAISSSAPQPLEPARHKLHGGIPRKSLCSPVLILNYNF